jgi:hypothetical protein
MHLLFIWLDNNPLRQFAISAWLTSQFDAHHDYFSLAGRDCTRFLLFTSTWTIIISIHRMFFFCAAADSVFGSTVSHIFLYVDLLWSELNLLTGQLAMCSLCLTWVFWTAGAASITATLGGQLNRKLVHFPITHRSPCIFLVRKAFPCIAVNLSC